MMKSCGQCGVVFRAEEAEEHAAEDMSYKPWACAVCPPGATFLSAGRLKEHAAADHPDQRLRAIHFPDRALELKVRALLAGFKDFAPPPKAAVPTATLYCRPCSKMIEGASGEEHVFGHMAGQGAYRFRCRLCPYAAWQEATAANHSHGPGSLKMEDHRSALGAQFQSTSRLCFTDSN